MANAPNGFDFLYDDAPPQPLEVAPKKYSKFHKRNEHPPTAYMAVPWMRPKADGTLELGHVTVGVEHPDHATPRKPEWTATNNRSKWTLRTGLVKLGIVDTLDTGHGFRLYQWIVLATGEEGEYLDPRGARRAVEKRTLVWQWSHLYNAYGELKDE